ncbi:MAG: hypothetical protein AB1454_06675 [Candidatus Auribacterota bacterium]
MKKYEALRNLFYRAAVYFILIVSTLWIFSIFMRYPYLNSDQATIGGMVYGTAQKPYVYRALIPQSVRLCSALIPAGLESDIRQRLAGIEPLNGFFERKSWDNEYALENVILILLLLLCMFGFTFSTGYLLDGIFRFRPAVVRDAVHILAIWCVAPFFDTEYIYDLSTLFLFTLALGLMVRCQFKWYFLVFLLACVNKETAVLLLLLFVMYYRTRMKKDLFVRRILVQAVVYCAVKGALTFIFRDNPGGVVEFHLFNHNYWLLTDPFPMSFVVQGILFLFLIFYRWTDKPLFLRYAMVWSIPLSALMLFFGYLEETRAALELYPVLVLLSAHSLVSASGFVVEDTAKEHGVSE